MCPNLTELNITTLRVKDIVKPIASMLFQLQLLQDVAIIAEGHADLTPILSALRGHGRLQSLALNAISFDQATSFTNTSSAFTSLRRLELKLALQTSSPSFQSLESNSKLKELELGGWFGWNISSVRDVEKHIREVGRQTQLETLTLYGTISTIQFPAAGLDALLACSSLRSLRIVLHQPLEIGDADIKCLASSLPFLQHFVLKLWD